MNRFNSGMGRTGEAELVYSGGDYQVRKPGAFVRCAVTGKPVRLEDLRYWSVGRQEAYASPAAALEAERRQRGEAGRLIDNREIEQ